MYVNIGSSIYTLSSNSPSFQKLKYRIRIIKLIARVIGLLLSITTLIPLAITLNKFFATKDVFITVDGKSRTAWNANTKLWPMYMYFALSTISTFLNLVILIAYCWGIRYANRASAVESVFTGVVIVGHVVIWAVGAALYRAGKDEQAHARDLWGWTCSLGARQIQDAFAKEINFGQYCNIQVGTYVVQALVLLQQEKIKANDEWAIVIFVLFWISTNRVWHFDSNSLFFDHHEAAIKEKNQKKKYVSGSTI